LESNKNIDNRTLVDLIASELPTFITNIINRHDTKCTNDLFNELGKHDDIITKKSYRTSENKPRITKTEEKPNSKQPCKISERKGKENRYHHENLCWFKEDKDKNIKINKITNSILEIDNTEDPKN